MLPSSAFVNVKIKQGAGARALGTSGRSLLQVLDDVRRHLQGLRAVKQLTSGPASSAGPISGNGDLRSRLAVEPAARAPELPTLPKDRQALYSIRSLFVLEVEDSEVWSIVDGGQGAAHFFRNAPGGSVRGQSLANFVRCEEMTALRKLWPHNNGMVAGKRKKWNEDSNEFRGHEGENSSQIRIHLLNFSPEVGTGELQALGKGMQHASYATFLVQLIPIPLRNQKQEGQSQSALHVISSHRPRMLIIGMRTNDEHVNLTRCAICDKLVCMRTEDSTPLQLQVHVPRLLFSPASKQQDCRWTHLGLTPPTTVYDHATFPKSFSPTVVLRQTGNSTAIASLPSLSTASSTSSQASSMSSLSELLTPAMSMASRSVTQSLPSLASLLSVPTEFGTSSSLLAQRAPISALLC